MANTIITFPFLDVATTFTVDVVKPADLSTLQAGIVLSVVSGVQQGTVTGTHAGKLAFVVKSGSTVEEHRVRTIEDTAGPFTILTGLDGSGLATLPANPSDDDVFCTGYGITYNDSGVRADAIKVSVRMIKAPQEGGISIGNGIRTATSATATIEAESVVGYFEFQRLVRGATYEVWIGDASTVAITSGFGQRSTGKLTTFVVDDAASIKLPSIFGTIA